MPARKPRAPRAVAITQVARLKDPEAERAVSQLASDVKVIQSRRSRVTVRADLADGTNKIAHGLGRACEGYTLSYSIDIGGASRHYIDRSNPRPDLEIWIVMISEGSTFTDTTIEVY